MTQLEGKKAKREKLGTCRMTLLHLSVERQASSSRSDGSLTLGKSSATQSCGLLFCVMREEDQIISICPSSSKHSINTRMCKYSHKHMDI